MGRLPWLDKLCACFCEIDFYASPFGTTEALFFRFVRPSEARKIFFRHVNGSVRPSVLSWPFLARFRAFAGERLEEMALILHANVSWPTSKTIRLWSRSVSCFWSHFYLVKWVKLVFFACFRRKHGGNRLKFCMLLFIDHRQKWLDYSDGLFIFFTFWRYFDLVKRFNFGVFWHFLTKAWRE